MKTIATYIRCSTDKQDLEHQRRSILEWIDSQGYHGLPIEEFVDYGASGASTERTGYLSLMESIHRRKIVRVVLFEGSRASRDLVDYLSFLKVADREGVVVDIVGEGVVGFGTAQDMLLAAISGYSQQIERENISARIRSGMAAAKAKGAKFGGAKVGNTNRLGYRKQYPAAMVAEVQELTNRGLKPKEIAETLGTRYTSRASSDRTIRRIQSRYKMC